MWIFLADLSLFSGIGGIDLALAREHGKAGTLANSEGERGRPRSMFDERPRERVSLFGDDERERGTRPKSDVRRSLDGVPAWLDRYGGLGDGEAEEIGANEVLRYLQDPAFAETVWRSLRRLRGIQAQTFLLSLVHAIAAGGRIPRELQTREVTPWNLVRAVRRNRNAPRAPQRSKAVEQYFREYPDALRALSFLVAPQSSPPWDNPCWELSADRAIPKGTVKDRPAKLRCLGNAVVPQVAREAFRRLAGL